MAEDKIEDGVYWNNHVIPTHGNAIFVEGPSPGPNYVGKIQYTLIEEINSSGNYSKHALIHFPWKRIR